MMKEFLSTGSNILDFVKTIFWASVEGQSGQIIIKCIDLYLNIASKVIPMPWIFAFDVINLSTLRTDKTTCLVTGVW